MEAPAVKVIRVLGLPVTMCDNDVSILGLGIQGSGLTCSHTRYRSRILTLAHPKSPRSLIVPDAKGSRMRPVENKKNIQVRKKRP